MFSRRALIFISTFVVAIAVLAGLRRCGSSPAGSDLGQSSVEPVRTERVLPSSAGQSQSPSTAASQPKLLERCFPLNLLASQPDWAGKAYFLIPQGEGDGHPAVDGDLATAYVRVGSAEKSYMLEPNQAGEFPRVSVGARETIPVLLSYSRLEPGTAVFLGISDGGRLNEGKLSDATVVAADHTIHFNFTTTEQAGMHRVFLTAANGDRKMLHFWVGPEPEFHTTAN